MMQLKISAQNKRKQFVCLFVLNKYGDQAPMSNMIPYLELANCTTKNNRVQNLSELEMGESMRIYYAISET